MLILEPTSASGRCYANGPRQAREYGSRPARGDSVPYADIDNFGSNLNSEMVPCTESSLFDHGRNRQR